jgi:anti-anti-sigma regulatory factor
VARDAFTDWLNSLGAAAEDTEALHLAMVEVVTNAIEHAFAYPPEPPFNVDTAIEASGVARARVTGAVDIVTAGQLARRLLAVSRGGTVPLVADLTGVTQLASAGVRALYQVRDRLTVHQQDMTLLTAPGSSAQVVLDLVQLAHVAADDPGRR